MGADKSWRGQHGSKFSTRGSLGLAEEEGRGARALWAPMPHAGGIGVDFFSELVQLHLRLYEKTHSPVVLVPDPPRSHHQGLGSNAQGLYLGE